MSKIHVLMKRRSTTNRHACHFCPLAAVPGSVPGSCHRVVYSSWCWWFKKFMCIIIIAFIFLPGTGNGFSFLTTTTTTTRRTSSYKRDMCSSLHQDDDEVIRPRQEEQEEEDFFNSNDRRSFLQKYMMMIIAVSTSTVGGVLTGTTAMPLLASAADDRSSTSATAEITDKIYITIKGLPSGNAKTIITESGSVQPQQPSQTRRIVIGLFGKNAPQSVMKIKALVDKGKGLTAPCKPRVERSLQKEQLEANKVYNACIEGQDQGVTLAYSSIWRIIANERIDVGAVSGKFVAREYPNWLEEESNTNNLKHDIPGVVSVRRGNDGGFGFTIYPGSNNNNQDVSYLDKDHIVLGRVLPESMDVVHELNAVPVIASSKINYMALAGGTSTKNAPNRSCRYGGPMYCNENKPLLKLSITETGIL